MAWARLTPDDLKLKLAEDEIDKLANCSVSEEKLSTLLQD